MRRVYLDTQQYRYLVDPRPALGCPAELLRDAVNRGTIEIVGSLEILQELTLITLGNHRAYLEQLDVFTDLVGRRILQPTDERHLAEQRHGGLLDDDARYLPRDRRRQILRGARNHREAAGVAEEATSGKQAYAATEQRMRATVKEALAVNGERVTFATMSKWFEQVDLDEWNRDVVEEGMRKGLYRHDPGTGTGLEQFPTSWLLNSYRAARTVYTIGDGRRIKPSDLADAHHAACGAYYDILVTDDAGFIDTLELFGPRLPFTWMRSTELVEQLLTST